MVDLAAIEGDHSVLEPSAGTGALLDAIRARVSPQLTAVELNTALAGALRQRFDRVTNADFLECAPASLGTFDRTMMNPPFAQGADIRHILHARSFLRPGGRLVALCAGGPRQYEALRPLVEAGGGLWDELPSGTFSGTGVRAILLTMDR